ncbi:hypothetical protein P7H74_01025 [Enterococcus devriesei]|uniref:hypothetical protein n=1 Tax=Enterococcus devriesei TaxID=319970 RepID=UPI001C0FCFBC|nr:hypothetical protein [Enterococcus devriesei]MBU5364788.1 hypothetical protein [Enterococcus devriesei]MDT2820333.1 hypothetical protein [Enterococcus devriesei]
MDIVWNILAVLSILFLILRIFLARIHYQKSTIDSSMKRIFHAMLMASLDIF